MKLQIAIAIIALVLAAPVAAPGAEELKIDRWLVLGPAGIVADGSALAGGAEAALDFDHLPYARLEPKAGAGVQWSARERLSWTPGAARFTGAASRQAVYLAVYLESRRWLQADLVVEAPFPVRLYLDGEALAKPAAPGKSSVPLTLANGKHLLLVKGILDAGAGKAAVLQASLKNKPAFAGAALHVSLEAGRRSGMEDVLNTVSINDVQLSPDGRRVAVALSQLPRGGKSSRRWLEVLDAGGGDRVFTSQGLGSVSNFAWLGDSRRFAYTREEKGLTDICQHDLDGHAGRTLVAGIANFTSCWWANDGSFGVYATGEEAGTDKAYRHVRRLDDRFRTPEPRQSLTLFVAASGARQSLAGFADNFSQVRISPDNRMLLLASYVEDPKVRPFHRNTLVLHHLADGRREKLLDDPWIEDFSWSPDSGKLLLLGGPSAFSGLGSTLPAGTVPNDFDIQAYVYDLNTKKAEVLSRTFAPSIDSAVWHPNGGILLKVTDQDYARLYRCSPGARKFSRLEAGCDAVESVSWSRAGRAVFSGSGLGQPQKLYVLDLGGGAARVLKDYNREAFSGVRFGRSENWSFKTREGRTIGGYLCYPPDFDPARLWPCIVNFYGGTTPIGRSFGGRYPKDWYAANGYVVCVLQPSGAIGYGQEFSSAHVNDWGEITSEEIIRGVEELLRTHPFIDNRRVGAIGASYGGFMTQVLAAKTDLFAGLVSHAGISALSSYWGVGDWGYSYSGVATANSFPWNRKDIYVGHSPLFMAERIRKPLLLLHGEDDNNVPPGESYQMFAALKLLGRETALVTFPGQQHFILAPAQRIRWLQTIMAWFDRWLKGEPEWWNELYPEEK
jgi:dipeptidyl aminopeptidase/acylaminoacyl peptidase